MKAISKLITVCVAALNFSAAVCKAEIIYSNLGPYDTSPDGPVVLGSASATYFGLAAADYNEQLLFQSNGSYSVSSFTLGVSYDLLSLPVSPIFNAYLYSNNQTEGYNPTGPSYIINQPGTEIAEIGQALQAPSSPGLITFSPPTPISLTKSLYWIVLTPNNPLASVTWDNNSLEVDGSLLTPEPATFGLLGFALPILLALRKKRPTKP